MILRHGGITWVICRLTMQIVSTSSWSYFTWSESVYSAVLIAFITPRRGFVNRNVPLGIMGNNLHKSRNLKEVVVLEWVGCVFPMLVLQPAMLYALCSICLQNASTEDEQTFPRTFTYLSPAPDALGSWPSPLVQAIRQCVSKALY